LFPIWVKGVTNQILAKNREYWRVLGQSGALSGSFVATSSSRGQMDITNRDIGSYRLQGDVAAITELPEPIIVNTGFRSVAEASANSESATLAE
jgi:hypothetical protein